MEREATSMSVRYFVFGFLMLLWSGVSAPFCFPVSDAQAKSRIDRDDLKTAVAEALFSPTWRIPEGIKRAFRLEPGVTWAFWTQSRAGSAERDEIVSRTVEAVGDLIDTEEFPNILPVPSPSNFFHNDEEPPISEPSVQIWISGEKLFRGNVFVLLKLLGMKQHLPMFLEKGCLSLPAYSNGVLYGSRHFIRYDVTDDRFLACLRDVVYVSHGVIGEGAHRRDLALRVLYDPAVTQGLTRTQYIELIDGGALDHLLAP